MKKFITYLSIVTCFAIVLFASCKKTTVDPTPLDPCAGKTISVTATLTAAASPTVNNGSIAATATGSTGFTYSLNNGTFQSSGTFTGLAAGTYAVKAKDASGCTGAQNFTLVATSCPAITVTALVVQTSSAGATNGSITASASGSTGFTFSKDNGATFQPTGVFSSLGVGSYNIIAKDANGCTGSASFSVTAITCPTITITPTVTNAAGPTATNGAISVSATGGVAPYQFSKDNGVTFQGTGNFASLASGTYSIVAKDANNCTGSLNVVVANNCPTITHSAATGTTVKCAPTNTGSVTITATGSTGLTYSLNSGAFQSSNLFGNLAAANYTYTVKDANGCTVTGSTNVSQAAAGPMFTAVKSILAANCATSGCHSGSSPQSGINFADDCTIVAQSARIKIRAVDANPSVMPPSGSISAANKTAITNWVNAGGQHNN
jgi:SprB repeat